MSNLTGSLAWGNDVGLADVVPPSETNAGSIGNMTVAARGNHTHPRLTSATLGVLDGSGEATITFTRLFDAQPCIDFTYVETTDNPPVVFKVKSWVIDGNGKYTGCVAKGYRGQFIPQNLVSLLISAVYNVFGGSASGVAFTCIALVQST